MRCSFPSCDRDSSKNVCPGIAFYRLPEDDALRTAWKVVLGQRDWEPPLGSIVCSEHLLVEKLMETRQQIPGALVCQDKLDQSNLRIPCDGKVCRICLATEGEMQLMTDSKELNETYETLTGILTAEETHLPRYLCAKCTERLTNCALLRCKSLRAHFMLMDIVKRHGRITVDLVQSMDINNTFSPELMHNLIKDNIAVHDKDLVRINTVSDSRNLTSREVTKISENTNKITSKEINRVLDAKNVLRKEITNVPENTNKITSKVSNASDSKHIDIKAGPNTMIDLNNIKKEKDDLNNETDFKAVSTIKIEIAVDDEVKQEDVSVNSFKVNKSVASVDKVQSVGQNVGVASVVKVEYVDVVRENSVKDVPRLSDSVEYRSSVSAGKKASDPLQIQSTPKTLEELYDPKTSHVPVVYKDEKPYSCVCKMAFKYEYELQTHLITAHSNASLYSCDFCGETFKKKSHLKSHLLKIHPGRKPHACEICKKEFKQKYELKSHSIMHSDEKPFTCPICNLALRRKGQLRSHYLTQHSNEKPFCCDICKKCFSEKRGLRLHLTKHSNERPHSCHICKRRYKGKNSLRLHLITHSDKRPYSCYVCNKSFILKAGLQSHLRSHTDEKPYSCHICKKSLKSKSSLQAHLKIHSTETRYSCGICQKAFYHRRHLKKHVTRHYDEKLYSCDVCKKSFRQKRTLEAHFLKEDCSQTIKINK